MAIVFVFAISVLGLHYNLSACIFSFKLLIAHLYEHVIVHFVRPSSFQFSRYSAIHVRVYLTHLFKPWASAGGQRILMICLLTCYLMIDLLKILVAIAGVF